jgi:hypothetical protein
LFGAAGEGDVRTDRDLVINTDGSSRSEAEPWERATEFELARASDSGLRGRVFATVGLALGVFDILFWFVLIGLVFPRLFDSALL